MLYIHELRRYERWFKQKEHQKNDYKYKSFIISNKIDYFVNKINYKLYLNDSVVKDNISLEYCYSYDTLNIMFDSLADEYGFSSILEAMRINNAKYHRIARLKFRIESIISYNTSFFLTLTFTNDYLSSTDEKTRRTYVQRYLKSISDNYVANIDFGKKNHREHYHAVVNCPRIDSKLWKYGNLDFELINKESDMSVELLSKYVAKLTNHAIKETCKRTHLLYPKKTRR